ncbi:MAG TPA: hypothetical protein VNN21_06440 [Dehalococcoidia bacterium]|nr:hypothetical protein [Dehalococcoidia bacterium]
MRLLVLGLALLLIAAYLLTQNRKIEFELEIEPKGGGREEDE